MPMWVVWIPRSIFNSDNPVQAARNYKLKQEQDLKEKERNVKLKQLKQLQEELGLNE